MKTTVDWFKFRTLSDPWKVLEAIRPAFGTAADLLSLGDQGPGADGWKWRRPLLLANELRLGAVDYGGEQQRGWVRAELTGSGCEWVQGWEVMAGLVHVLDQPSIKRLDLALTTYHGEVTHEAVLAAHARREFSTGGRHPHYREVGGSDPRAGRTIYVGRRDSGKFLRCYEKGWEILKDVPASWRDSVQTVHFNAEGHVKPEEVYRVEVEFKDKDDRVIPWPALVDRDQYFAGSYPFCASLLPGVEPRRVTAMPDFGPKMALASALDHCRRSYGGILRAALVAYGGDVDRVFGLVASEKPSQQLVQAGILTVDHE